MTDNYDSGFDLVLSDYELEALIDYYETEALPDYQSCNDDDMWYGCQIGERMFDLNVWADYGGIPDKEKIVCTVYECDWDGKQNNWKTNCRHSWTLTEENEDAIA